LLEKPAFVIAGLTRNLSRKALIRDLRQDCGSEAAMTAQKTKIFQETQTANKL